jgi:hypothetical protein
MLNVLHLLISEDEFGLDDEDNACEAEDCQEQTGGVGKTLRSLRGTL